MNRLLTERDVADIAAKFGSEIDRVRAASHETEWIKKLLHENPNLNIDDAVMDIVVAKTIKGDFDKQYHYSLETNKNTHLTDRLLYTFAEETGLDLSRLKAAAAQSDKIDQLMKDENIDYVNALLKLY